MMSSGTPFSKKIAVNVGLVILKVQPSKCVDMTNLGPNHRFSIFNDHLFFSVR